MRVFLKDVVAIIDRDADITNINRIFDGKITYIQPSGEMRSMIITDDVVYFTNLSGEAVYSRITQQGFIFI